MVVLPNAQRDDIFSIRLESIGGLGANLAGKIIAGIAENELHLNVASFSSYGSEKKGTPVKAFIRFSQPNYTIRINTPIKNPDILIVFRDTLLKNPDVLAGCTQYTKLIINTYRPIEELKHDLNMPELDVTLIDATGIALEKKVKVNGILLGVLAKVCDFIPLDAVINTLKNTTGKKYPHLLESNIQAAHIGYEQAVTYHVEGDSGSFYPEYVKNAGVGYKQQYLGGLLPHVGNTLKKSHAVARYGVIPLFNEEKCIHCTMCHTVCPDQCIVWAKGKDAKTGQDSMNMTGIDYQYCKGCLKCVEICPVNALTQAQERDYDVQSITRHVHVKQEG